MASTLQKEAVNKIVGRLRTRLGPVLMCLAALSALGVCQDVAAKSVDISLLSTRYTTDVRVRETKGPDAVVVTDMKRVTTSNAPVSDEVHGLSPMVDAGARADMFSVRTSTNAMDPIWATQLAVATAGTVLTFSTPTTGLASLTFSFAGNGQAYYSDGNIGLVDLTLDQPVFSHSWTCCAWAGTVPWGAAAPGVPRYSALIEPQAWLLSSHVYALTLQATTYANMDGQDMMISVSGLSPVATPAPEPSTYGLLLAGLCVVGLVVYRR